MPGDDPRTYDPMTRLGDRVERLEEEIDPFRAYLRRYGDPVAAQELLLETTKGLSLHLQSHAEAKARHEGQEEARARITSISWKLWGSLVGGVTIVNTIVTILLRLSGN